MAIELTSRERIRLALSHKEADRVPMLDICYWPETIARWEMEGLPKGADPIEFFGLERVHTIELDSTLQLPIEVAEEGEGYKLEWNADGVLMKSFSDSYVPPCEVGWRIQTFADWLAVRERLRSGPERLGEDALGQAMAARQRGQYIVLSPVEPAWFFIRTLGLERAAIVMMEEPDFFADVLETATQFSLGMLDTLVALSIPVDGLWYFSDLCYKNGLLFSPRLYRAHVLPRMRRVTDHCHELGLQVIYHCDGYVGEFIPLLIEAGVDCIQPLEARADNDVRVYRPRFGHDIAFFGNINADVAATGDRDAIEEEVRGKVLCAKEGGGYLYHIDHSVPPGVSFAAYSWMIECVKKYGRYG
ncbi:MAG: uroporphyrinogen decarboxylase family protein [Anaerolineae bacterium]